MNLRDQLIRFEGWVNNAYADPLTHGAPYTCGVGATGPDVGPATCWTDQQIGERLDADIAKATALVMKALPWAERLSEPRQAVLIGMCFQMGAGGLMGFHNMLTNAHDGYYATAAQDMLHSKWAKQTPSRAKALAKQMQTGEWAT